KAAAAARRLGCSPAVIDIADAASWADALAGIAIVVVCIDQADEAFAGFVLETGRTYVDITASDAFFRKVEGLDALARARSGKAVLSVGFAPGLTNLMVKACADRLQPKAAHSARIGIMLGLGDVHGPAAIAWTLETMFAAGAPMPDSGQMSFAGSKRPHPVYAFDFADQHVVRRHLGLDAAETFLTFDSAAMTRLAFALVPLLRGRRAAVDLLKRLLPAIRIGSARAALSVEVSACGEGVPQSARATYEGTREADLTALIAALVVRKIMERPPAPGVRHIDEVLSLQEIVPVLEAEGGAIRIDPFVGAGDIA
ncbi:MAG TPA: hypothetical protein VD840_17080, partial [Sinorhizobium sp.]|nr:hypothetical protein [Sinorhizobium sp.]